MLTLSFTQFSIKCKTSSIPISTISAFSTFSECIIALYFLIESIVSHILTLTLSTPAEEIANSLCSCAHALGHFCKSSIKFFFFPLLVHLHYHLCIHQYFAFCLHNAKQKHSVHIMDIFLFIGILNNSLRF